MSARRKGARRQRRDGVSAPSPAGDRRSRVPAPDSEVGTSPTAPTDGAGAAPDDLVYAEKQVAFYQTSIEAFLENRMERDKSLLTLSTAGVGVEVTLWTTIGVETAWELGIGVGAAVAFMGAILLILCVFKENANYFEALTTKQDFERPHRRLVRLDRFAGGAFYLGLALALAGAVMAAHRKYLEKPDPPNQSQTMSDPSKDKATGPAFQPGASPSPAGSDSAKPVNEGAQGFHKLVPNIETGSAKNFHNLAPQNPAPPAAPPQVPPPTAAPSGNAKPGPANAANAGTTKRP